ncbi:hypothetical protein HC028_09905 [Planosporangium flavigriseum]|uniref:hypothetical protein n=1 Tax=Planosporangium flavigriseum TaxID=373681 RepID=UPI00143A068A|nr:hypothetical protein [Planosporangium flavigriseum]NJC64814.1 hypothetical protein [Planosporangium flavigriseum]
MTGSRRLYVWVLSCGLAMTALLVGGAGAGARAAAATMQRTGARCARPAATADVRHEERAAGSWRGRTLRAAGCGAWRKAHRMHHRHSGSHRGA